MEGHCRTPQGSRSCAGETHLSATVASVEERLGTLQETAATLKDQLD